MTEGSGSGDTDLANIQFAYSHLIFTREIKDYSRLPGLPGIYFLTDPGRIYIGRGSSLKERIPKSLGERQRYGQHFSRFHFIPIPIFRSYNLHEIETEFIAAANTIIYKNKLEEKYGLLLLNSKQTDLLPLSAWLPPYMKDFYYPVGAIQTVLQMMGIPVRDVLMGDVI